MTPKVIIFDLDSTLAESKQPITKEMAEAIRKLLDKMPVAVMSGADLPQFRNQFLFYIPASSNLSNLYLFPTSAAECLTYRDDKWVQAYDYAFTKSEKKKITNAIEKVLKKTKLVDGEPSFGERVEDRGEQITLSALGQAAPLEIKSKWDPDHKKRQIIKEELEKLIPEFQISIGGTTSIDVTRKDISKEDGVQWLSEYFKIAPSEMLYVGDALFEGGNDSDVIRTKVATKQVSGPAEALEVINGIING